MKIPLLISMVIIKNVYEEVRYFQLFWCKALPDRVKESIFAEITKNLLLYVIITVFLDSICSSNKFLCDNGECIGHSFVCDGDNRCSDGSDEKNCECLAGQFRCLVSGECVEKRSLCNGIAECDDASDEKNCCKFLF